MPYRALESKTGFRLPNRNEWELAARWRNDDTNTVPGYSNPWFTRGNSASGAAANYTDATETLRYAGGGPLPVKSRLPNALGLYDMSGNVWELLNDGWFYAAYNIQNCNIQVIETGGWGYHFPESGGHIQSAPLSNTYYYEADGQSDWDGLRLVLPLP
jgi:formylglycine-generating enzyme required for sulfatase activity